MDIRRFFNAGSKNSSTKNKSSDKRELINESRKRKSKKRIIDSESDSEDPLTKNKKIRIKKRIIDDDSDSEEKLQETPIKKSPKLPKQIPIDVDDFFGSDSVKSKVKTSPKKNDIKEKSSTTLSAKLAEAKSSASKDSSKVVKKSPDSTESESKIAEKNKKLNRSNHVKDSKDDIIHKTPDKPFTSIKSTNFQNKHIDSTSDTSPSLKVQTESSKEISEKDIKEVSHKHADQKLSSDDSNQKRRSNYLQYRQYLDRKGPQALGTKEIPEGKPNCLAKLTFVFTGVLESFEREEIKEVIEKYNGRVTNSLSKKTDYLVVGRDPGPSKIEKAQKFGIKQLDENELLDLIRTSSEKISVNENKTGKGFNIKNKENKKRTHSDDDDIKKIEKKKKSVNNIENKNELHKSNDIQYKTENLKPTLSEETKITPDVINKIASETVNMWVDKYKPLTTKQIIGQQGDRSNVKKLSHWLLNWQKSRKSKSSYSSKDDGSEFKAVLLSGSPGIGKTTTAHLVCKECNFDYIEMNASDTRSKKSLKDEVIEILSNKTLNNFVNGSAKSNSISCQHAIIMDEVDGMAGNEDRGGMQELIALIKSTKIPIICICNERSSPKIRSLANYCYDLRFMRPRVEQIKSAMMSITFKENIQITPNILNDIIVASNQDIRQVMHNLSLWCVKKSLTAEQAKGDIGRGTKNVKLGPFDVLRKVFSHSETQHMSIHEKSDLFFNDYSLIPLFVQENYITVQPVEAKGNIIKHLQLLSSTADSICDGDLVERQIRISNNWSLLPVEAIYSCVIPGDLMGGYLTQMINFPSWLEKNSSQNHNKRLLQELHTHMHLRISANKTDLNLDQLTILRNSIVNPLINEEMEGIPKSIDVLKNYCLLRQDLDSIIEITQWSGKNNPMAAVNTKIKSAFTRAYNKEGITNPYSIGTLKKSKRKESRTDLLGEEDEVNVSEESEDDSFDGMIKAKTKPNKKKEVSSSKRRKKN